MKKTKFLLQSTLLFLIASFLIPVTGLAADGQDTSSVTILVNKHHQLPPNYLPTDLINPAVLTRNIPGDDEAELRAPAARKLTAMFAAESKETGGVLVLSSGFRSYASQKYLYTSSLQMYGSSASEFVANAGTSEHQTGLAADIMPATRFCAVTACFAMTSASQWLRTHSYQYGFILRYPALQESVTGYGFEPWHYRYVGVALATHLHKTDQTLEQYYGD
jgi:D-alanyl-D-alanine carboxypeptidase